MHSTKTTLQHAKSDYVVSDAWCCTELASGVTTHGMTYAVAQGFISSQPPLEAKGAPAQAHFTLICTDLGAGISLGLGFGVWGLGFRSWGLGFSKGLGFGV